PHKLRRVALDGNDGLRPLDVVGERLVGRNEVRVGLLRLLRLLRLFRRFRILGVLVLLVLRVVLIVFVLLVLFLRRLGLGRIGRARRLRRLLLRTEEQQCKREGDHNDSPASLAPIRPAVGDTSSDSKSRCTSATASRSSTMMATSRRNPRLIAA